MKIVIETMEIEPVLRLLRKLLRGGVRVNALTGTSVRAFLCEQLGLTEEYVEERISTIFLDGKPVDNMNEAVLHDGQVLALSAAMPGLVGATMRRGGFYAAFRSAITYHPDNIDDRSASGEIILKLFNMVAEEIGSRILGRGIIVPSDRLINYLTELEDEFWTHCSTVSLDNSEADGPSILKRLHDANEEVTLFVREAARHGKMQEREAASE